MAAASWTFIGVLGVSVAVMVAITLAAPFPALRVAVETSKGVYAPGEPVSFRVLVTVPGSRDVTLTASSSCWLSYAVTDLQGLRIASGDHRTACLEVLTVLTLRPGETRGLSFAWDQTDDAGEPVASGRFYRIIGIVAAEGLRMAHEDAYVSVL